MHTDEYPDVTGVILAGGKSSRMGQDKATLRLGGTTLFGRMLRIFQELFPQVLIAGDRSDLARFGVPAFADIYAGSALGGLFTGLLVAQTPWIFVAPCDIPYPDPGLIRTILARREEFEAVAPRTRAGWEPLLACYHKSCLEPMRSLLERNHLRVYDLYPLIRLRPVDEEELPSGWQRALRNINTPEELRALKEKTS